jgi:hypothetical protein
LILKSRGGLLSWASGSLQAALNAEESQEESDQNYSHAAIAENFYNH